MTQDLILTTEQDGVLTITLNRPKSRNALNKPLLQQFCSILEISSARRDIRAIIIAGGGDKAFCAGADLKERAGMSAEETRLFLRLIRGTMDIIESMPMPTIAAVEGFAFGGGCEILLACDLRIFSESSVVGLTECALGIIPGAGGTQRLPMIVGAAKAKELIFTARRIDANEALKIGLANHITAKGGALQKALEICEEIKGCAPIAVEAAKAAIQGGLNMGIQEGLLLERRSYEVTLYTEDRIEALAAFKEKKKASIYRSIVLDLMDIFGISKEYPFRR